MGRPAVDVTWETSTKTNLGLDLYLFNSSLQFQFDLFKERRENIFLQRAAVPSFVGITTMPYGNLGVVENKGFEITVDYSKQIQDFGIMFRANFSYNKNKIIEDDTADRPLCLRRLLFRRRYRQSGSAQTQRSVDAAG